MIDTIKPMGLDLSKDLHGHVRVELRDRWTGRVVDSQEKDNLVTNAVLRAMMTLPWAATSESYMLNEFAPIYEKALGCVLLFDNTLTEAATNIHLPGSAKLVGYAGQGSDTDTLTGGSYNPNESAYVSNGFTTVWDFGTSQANGTIASLSRTSHQFALRGGVTTNGKNSILTGRSDVFSDYTHWLGYDETNHYGYFGLYYNSQTIGGVVYTSSNIYQAKIDLSRIGLVTSCMPPASQMTVVKSLTSSDGSTDARSFTYDKYANNFAYANGTTLHLIAMDGTHSTKTLTGTSGSLIITENYYWRLNGTTLYRISKSNVADVQSYTISQDFLAPCENDVLIAWDYSSDSANGAIIYPDGSSVSISGSGHAMANTNAIPIGAFYAFFDPNIRASTLFPSAHYLGTIANLDSPVTKSSSQTMKIIYTLTEA